MTPVALGRELDAALLGDRERVDVGAQGDPGRPLPRRATTLVARGPLELSAERLEGLGDEASGLVLLEARLRPAMQMPPPLDCVGERGGSECSGVEGGRSHRPVLWT